MNPLDTFHALLGSCVFGVILSAGSIAAHEGPPFPLFVDRELEGHEKISLWADPDIGEARFFIIAENEEGQEPAAFQQVMLWAEPKNGRLERQTYKAELQKLRNRTQFLATPYFDQRDMWKVGVLLIRGDGKQSELVTEVESTPPGFGPIDLLIYLFPFLLIAIAWVMSMRRRRAMRGQVLTEAEGNDEAGRSSAGVAMEGGQ